MPRFSGDQELELQLPSGRKVSELRFSKSKLSNNTFFVICEIFLSSSFFKMAIYVLISGGLPFGADSSRSTLVTCP